MNTKKKYYLVEKEILSEAILKVMEAKALLDQGKVKYVSEAVKAVGISRSVFYKYHTGCLQSHRSGVGCHRNRV